MYITGLADINYNTAVDITSILCCEAALVRLLLPLRGAEAGVFWFETQTDFPSELAVLRTAPTRDSFARCLPKHAARP